jgi:hypothetical protein
VPVSYLISREFSVLIVGSDTYLSNIFNCASCNTANSRTGATGISDFEALRDSCSNQGYAGANQTFATQAANSPTGQGKFLCLSRTAAADR